LVIKLAYDCYILDDNLNILLHSDSLFVVIYFVGMHLSKKATEKGDIFSSLLRLRLTVSI